MTFFPEMQRLTAWQRAKVWFNRVFHPWKSQNYVFPVLRSTFPNMIIDEIVKCQPMTAPIHDILEYDYRGERVSMTTYMILTALDQIESVKTWPYVITVKKREHAEDLMDIMVREARNRGIKIEDLAPGRVTLEGGAEYNFVDVDNLDRWFHGSNFLTDVVTDPVRRD